MRDKEVMRMIDISDVENLIGEGFTVEALEHGGQKQVFCLTKDHDSSKSVVKFVRIEEYEEDDYGDDPEKISLSGEEERTLREIRLMSAVSSPYLPKLKDGILEVDRYEKEGLNHIVFVEEFVGENSVKRLIANRYFDEPSKVKALMLDVAKALAVYSDFEDGFVHRDIKPGNIIYNDAAGTYVLIDGGIHLLPSSPTITPSNAFVGTQKYASIEQLTQGRRFLDWRSDLFSLGVVSYEAALRKHPFYARREAPEIGLNRHLNANYDPIPESNSMHIFNPIWSRMMTRYPHSRYTSPNDLILDIEGVEV